MPYSFNCWPLTQVGMTHGAFIQGLSEQLKDELASRDEPTDLQTLLNLTIKIDNILQKRWMERSARHPYQGPLCSSRSTPPEAGETGNYWPLNSRWRSGDTGWRGQSNHSLFGLIIRTWPT